MQKFVCPQCNQFLKAIPGNVDHNVRCPHCNAVITIPAEPQAAIPAEPQASSPAEPQATRNPIARDDAGAHSPREPALSRPSKKIDPEELIDMTAMVDIVFFLLIFFLVTSMSAIMSSAPLPRPETHGEEKGGRASQEDVDRKDSDAIVVKINNKDLIEIDGVPYNDIADLIVRLHHLRNVGGPETSLLVLGHGDASHGAAVAVLDAGYEVGIDRLRFSVIEDGAE